MELNNNEPNSTNEFKGWYDQILTIAKEHNFDLYKKLNINDDEIQKLPNENERISMLLCKNCLPIMVKKLFEIIDTKGDFKTEKGVKTLTNAIKETPPDPLIFIVKFAQDSFLAGVDSVSVMKNLMPKDFLEKYGSQDFNGRFIKIIHKRAPNVYQKYIKAGIQRNENNIASLHFR